MNDKELPIPKKPSQVVVETADGLSIDGFGLGFVLENGVAAQQLREDCVQVNVTFLAKSYVFKEGRIAKMTDKEKELLEMYESAFSGPEQQLGLAAIATFNRLKNQFKKEEIHTIAEILKALAIAPVVWHD